MAQRSSAFVVPGAAAGVSSAKAHRGRSTAASSSASSAFHGPSRSFALAKGRRARLNVANHHTTRMVAGDEAMANKTPADVPSGGKPAVTSAMQGTLVTGGLFLLWYAFNIVFNLMNKQVLNAWSKPLALSTVQLGIGSLMAVFGWIVRPSSRPKVSKKLLKALFLPTLSHLVGHVATCVSFSYVAVSFAHIVKAAEPAVSSVGSALFLGEVYSLPVYLSLLPIIVGVSLSAVSQLSFSWPGFLFAMLSNVAFASRNVFSKQNMGDFKDDKTLTPANIYGLMSCIALLVEIPFALAIEGFPALPNTRIANLLLGSGVFYTLYNTVSFMALGRTGVVTHAVGNILKRASVIVVSILFFKNPITLMNGVGMAVAIAGTAVYAFMKRRFSSKKAKSA